MDKTQILLFVFALGATHFVVTLWILSFINKTQQSSLAKLFYMIIPLSLIEGISYYFSAFVLVAGHPYELGKMLYFMMGGLGFVGMATIFEKSNIFKILNEVPIIGTIAGLMLMSIITPAAHMIWPVLLLFVSIHYGIEFMQERDKTSIKLYKDIARLLLKLGEMSDNPLKQTDDYKLIDGVVATISYDSDRNFYIDKLRFEDTGKIYKIEKDKVIDQNGKRINLKKLTAVHTELKGVENVASAFLF